MVIVIAIYQYLVTPVLKQDNIENHHVLEYINTNEQLNNCNDERKFEFGRNTERLSEWN